MTWNFHQYYKDSKGGLLSKIMVSNEERRTLKALRKLVRSRTREVFNEAKHFVRLRSKTETFISTISFENSRFEILTYQEKLEFAKLINEMEDDAIKAFLKLEPRFWTQGSFKYGTLISPYHIPPQEMDIDDGTYLPMTLFEDNPVVGHRFLQLLVDTSLKSLEKENSGWIFNGVLEKCGRIHIPDKHVHIDVPMYAIPDDQFREKETALMEAVAKSRLSFESFTASARNMDDFTLDSTTVNLLVRKGEKRWINSDPKIVENWFDKCCERQGSLLIDVCCIVKSWRDYTWPNGGGPSSIALMAAIVNILDEKPADKKDLDSAMTLIADNLPLQFNKGVASPDHTDEKPLFPSEALHEDKHVEIVEKISRFGEILHFAKSAKTKEHALKTISSAYGIRVHDLDLIVLAKAAAVYAQEPEVTSKPAKISNSMVSG